MDTPPEGYRTNVGICLAAPSRTKIFSASRNRHPDPARGGCLSQGGIDAGEEPRDWAAARELREETGATSAELVAEAPNWLTYDFPPDVRDKLNARLTGSDDVINLMGDGSEKPEFSEWSWMTPKQVIGNVGSFPA